MVKTQNIIPADKSISLRLSLVKDVLLTYEKYLAFCINTMLHREKVNRIK